MLFRVDLQFLLSHNRLSEGICLICQCNLKLLLKQISRERRRSRVILKNQTIMIIQLGREGWSACCWPSECVRDVTHSHKMAELICLPAFWNEWRIISELVSKIFQVASFYCSGATAQSQATYWLKSDVFCEHMIAVAWSSISFSILGDFECIKDSLHWSSCSPYIQQAIWCTSFINFGLKRTPWT